MNTLTQFATDLINGRIRVVDLTQTLSADFPALQLPPEFGQPWPFKQENISRYDERGPAWYWNNFSCSEHTGTHFDAPVHWVSGKDKADNTTDSIPAEHFFAQACVIDCSRECAENPDFLLTVDFLKRWEARHGRIPPRSWVFLRSDWSKRSMPEAFVNAGEDGPHTPGPEQGTVQWMIEQREVFGFGVESINTDAGQSYTWPTPFPCHYYMHGNSRYGLQCLSNLDQLPPQGALIVAAPLKIKDGSGSPLRVLALVTSEA